MKKNENYNEMNQENDFFNVNESIALKNSPQNTFLMENNENIYLSTQMDENVLNDTRKNRYEYIFNKIPETISYYEDNYQQIYNAEIDRRLSYQYRLHTTWNGNFAKLWEKEWSLQFDSPDDMSPDGFSVFLCDFESSEDLDMWIRYGYSKYEQEIIKNYMKSHYVIYLHFFYILSFFIIGFN